MFVLMICWLSSKVVLVAPESQRLPPPMRGSDRDHLPSGIDLYEEALDANKSKMVPHPEPEKCTTKQTKPSGVVMKKIKKTFMKRSASVKDQLQRKLSEQRNGLSAADTGFESWHENSSISTTDTGQKSLHESSRKSTVKTGHRSSHADSSMSTTDTEQNADSSITSLSEQQNENDLGQNAQFESLVDEHQSCCSTARATNKMFYLPSSDPEISSEVQENDELSVCNLKSNPTSTLHVSDAVMQDNTPTGTWPNDNSIIENDGEEKDGSNSIVKICNCKCCTHAINTDESNGFHREQSAGARDASCDHLKNRFTCIRNCMKEIEESIVNKDFNNSALDLEEMSSYSSDEGQNAVKNQKTFNDGVTLSSTIKKSQLNPNNHCSNQETQGNKKTPAALSEPENAPTEDDSTLLKRPMSNIPPPKSASITYCTPAEDQFVPCSTEHAQASSSTDLDRSIAPYHHSSHAHHTILTNQFCQFCFHPLEPRVLESEPYLPLCPYLCTMFRSHQAAARQRRRQHFISEGDSNHQAYQVESIHNSPTYPVLPGEYDWISDDLNSSGITRPLLLRVSSLVGKDWRRMLRELRIEEALIDELERGKTLQESAYQGLVKWKRRFGREATLKQLDDCLRKIGLTSVAEQINGYSTI